MQEADAGTPLELSPTTVRLFRVDLNPADKFVGVYRRLLSEDEQRRADRYVSAELTRRSIVCRGALRQILGQLLGRSPAELSFATGPHGKPALAAASLEFNVSHTGDLALVTVANGRAVGVDVEAFERDIQRDELTSRFFSERECRTYFALPIERRRQSFYRIWTCKEAYLKAIGAGLSFPLGQFSVSAHPDEPPGLLHVEGQPEEPSRWSFVVPEVDPTVAAALAVEGHGWTLAAYDWDHRTGTGMGIK